jgi:hypothetical protein
MATEKVTEKSLRYMDWNPYLHSVNDDLNIINRLATESYKLGSWKVKEFAINLQIFYQSREAYIMLPKTLLSITKIIDQFHRSDFIKDYEKRTPRAIEYEYKAIKVLLNCLMLITRSLSQTKIIPEVDITVRDKIDDKYEDVAV